MKKIIILSDTHDLLRPEVEARLAEADVIVHAGDLCSQEMVDALRAYAETYIVRGNNDGRWAQELPRSLSFVVEGLRFFMVHDKDDLPAGLSGVDVVVTGHSHRYAQREENGVLWLNPGGCGRRRFQQEITFAVMEAEDGRYRVEKAVVPQAAAAGRRHD